MLFGKIIPHNYQEKLLYATSVLLSKLINRQKNIQEMPVQNILAVKLDEIGDMCYTLHVFDALKIRYPQAKITVWCKPFCDALLTSHPAIDQIIHSYEEAENNYDLCLELRGNWESIRYAFLNRPSIRLDRATIRFRNKQMGSHPHEIETNLQIIEPLFEIKPTNFPHLFASAVQTQACELWLRENQIGKFVMLHPGARKELRRWSPEKFARLAEWLHHQYGLSILFTGDQSELNLIQSIIDQTKVPAFSLAGRISLEGLIAFLSKADLYIGNESGPLCMAAVSGIKCLGLFGPGEPRIFYPPGKHSRYIHHVLDCNPCDQNHCVHPSHTCMDRISLLEVQEQIVILMTESHE